MFLYFTVYILLTTQIHLLLGCKTGNKLHNATTEVNPPLPLCASYDNNTTHFECSEKGNFSNSIDLTCGSYYLCEEGNGGEIVKTLNLCPNGTYYDPNAGICTTLYQCPCTDDETIMETNLVETCIIEPDPDYFECKSKGKFPNKNDPTCRSYFVCKREIFTGKFIKTKHICPLFKNFDPILGLCRLTYKCLCVQPTTENPTTTEDITTEEATTKETTTEEATTIETCVTEENPDYLVCTKQGRFPNLNDPTCQSYFLCERLFILGKFVKKKYSCPTGTYFDPDTEICDALYECPCTSPPTTTTEITTTTDSSCVIEENPDYFKCTAKGRFQNLNDPTCGSYFLCSKLLLTYTKKLYYCPTTSYFDPSLGICSIEYTCPCTQKTSTTAETTTESSSTVTSTSLITTTELSTSTTEACEYEDDPDYFTCTTQGQFPNLNDPTCESYFMCRKILWWYTKTLYYCPPTSYFDPRLSICSIEYSCPCTQEPSTTTSTTTAITTELLTTTKTCDYEDNPDYFECTTKGKFPNLNDPTCESYFLCSKILWWYTKTLYYCPPTSYFDPRLSICSVDYSCPCTQESSTTTSTAADTSTQGASTTTNSDTTSILTTTEISTTTIEACDYEEDPDYLVCTIKGRFVNKNDLTCQTYFLCSQKGSGAFVKTKYSCPTTSYFDPSLSACSIEYSCPCTQESSTTTSTAADTTTESSSTTTNSDTTSSVTSTSLFTTTELPTTTSEACDYEEDPDYLDCTVKGRFANKNDLTCQTYFLCSQKGSGSFVKTKYSCPTTSYFDPSLGACSVDYSCPCTQESSTTTSTAADTTTESSSTTTNSDTTSSVTSTSLLTTTELPTTTTEACDYEEDPNYLVCTVKGRFANKNDLTCQTYFLCSQKGSGSFVKTKYSCPTTSYFDPSLGACSVDYSCPCTQESSTTTSTAADTTTESSSTTTNSDTTSSVTSTSLLTTTELPTTTTEACDYEEDPDYLVCTVKGRFANKNDLTCQTYFLCSQKGSGSFVKTKYSCPTTSYFDPSLGACSVDYSCPCTQESSTTTSTAADTSTESSSTTTNSDTTSSVTSTSLLTTTELPTTTSEACDYEEDPDYLVCTVKGRFANKNDLTCQTYFLCSQKGSGTFVKTKYSCPTTSYFDPSLGACSVDYSCTCTQESSTTTSTAADTSTESSSTTTNSDTTSSVTSTSLLTTTELPTTTTEACDYEEDLDYLVCTVKGRFANKNDLTCQTYFLCSQKGSGSFVKTKYSCPTTSYFDPSLGACSVDYSCPCTQESSTTTSTAADTSTESSSTTTNSDTTSSVTSTSLLTTTELPTTTSEACDYEEDPDYLVCTVKGRFANKNDLTCQTYFLCSQKGSGTFVKTKYSCPTTSYFDPSLGACSVDYSCPCTQESSTAADTSTESSSTTTNIDTTPSLTSTSLLTTTELPTTTTEACDYEEDPDYLVCTVKGKFANKNDLTCQTYFLCNQKGSGTFVKTKYSCPTTSYFDPSLSACSIEYSCPCTQEPFTTTSIAIDTTTESSSTTTTSDTTSSETSTSLLTTTEVSTTTTEACVYEDDPDYLVCTVKGRFANKNDLTCQTYFLCSQKGTGSFVKTKYSCPTTSYFDPSLGACSVDYTCPCTQESSTTTSTAADTTTESSSTTTTSDTSSETSTSLLTTTELLTTTTETCDYEEDPDYLVCTVKGRFANKNDLTCQTYFLCSQKGSGTFVKTKYSCPTTSFFDPSLGACSVDYSCPCTQKTSITTSIAADTTTESSSTTTNIDTTPSVTSTSLLTTTELPTTTTEACDYEEDPDYLVCTVKGRFANKNDLTCQTYFLCSQKGSGSFVKTKYSCPTTSYFDPSLGACNIDYSCACTQEPSTTTPIAADTTTESSSTTTNSDTTSLMTSTSLLTTTELLTTTTEACDYEEDPDYLVCTVKGKFANKNDLTCQTYFLCNQKGSGTFVKTKYSCPTTSYFDPSLSACSIEYSCPCTQEPSTTAFTVADKTTESLSTTTNSETTSSVTSTSLLTTTEVSTTTAEACEYEENPDYLVCTIKGRFVNKNDLTCQTYFLCSQKGSGAFVKIKYACPTTSYFDPSLSACSIEYSCPCTQESSTTTSIAINTTTKSLSTTTTSDTTSSETSTSLLTTTEVSTTTTEACEYEEDPDYLVCMVKGRFANKNDLTCQTYFLCSQKGSGSFVKTKYSCPITSYFDPSLGACSVDYSCPCTQ